MVEGIRSYIKEHDAVSALLELGRHTPEEVISSKLKSEWYSSPDQSSREAFFLPLAAAWDILAFTRYPLRSAASSSADSFLHGLLNEGKRTIKLDPRQVKLLDAFADAAAIPHHYEASGYTIPEDALKERNSILRRAAQREWQEYERGKKEGGIADDELGRRHKSVSELAEREWQEYASRRSTERAIIRTPMTIPPSAKPSSQK